MHRTDPSAVAYWDHWLAQHPEQRTTVDEASRMVRGISFAPQQLPASQVDASWRDLQRRLPTASTAYQWKWLRVAAVLVVVLTGLLGGWWAREANPSRIAYATSYGETREYELPDGSRVTLNAHSQLTYELVSHPQPEREVYLDGEAFFSVVHLAGHAPTPFVVRTRDLAVQVLGTEFNVNTRRGRTQVVLDDGRVELQLPTDEKTNLQPGELAEYRATDQQVRKETVDTKLFTVWRDRKLKFDDTPLAEVALLLEENYGVEVQFDDPQLRTKRVTGEISARELDTIITALSKLFSITVQRSGDTIHIAES